jgi:hypothetical protein
LLQGHIRYHGGMLTAKQCYVKYGKAKTVLANFFALSIFGQFDYELESRLLKSENRFHAQHLLPVF